MARRGPALLVGLAALVVAPAAHATPGAYVTVGDDDAAGVGQYLIGGSGGLTQQSPFLVGPPNDLAGVVLTPDGHSGYVALNSSNPGQGPTTPLRSVLEFDVDAATGALTPKATASVPSGLGPVALAVSPDGRSAYATASLDDVVSQYDVDATTGALTPKSPPSVAAGMSPLALAMTPNGRSAYVANFNDDTISQYDIGSVTGALTPKAPPTVAAPGQPTDLGVTPDGRTLYAPTGPGVLQFDIDPTTGALTPKADPIVSTAIPSLVSVSPNGRSAYVDLPNTNRLLQYDVSPANGTLSPKSPPFVTVGSDPFPALNDVGVTPDSAHVYVLSGLTAVFQYDANAQTGALSPQSPPSVDARASQNHVAVTPDVPVAAFRSSPTGLSATFDGSGSTNIGGAIAHYDWDFGDGSGARDAGPAVSHAYASAGTYTATLTVTSATGCTLGSLVYVTRMAACSGAGARTSQAVSVAAGAPPPSPSAASPGVPLVPPLVGLARTRILTRLATVVGEPPHARTQIVLRCGARGVSRCRGTLGLSLSDRAGARAARLVRAGSARFSLRAGRRGRVTVRVGARAFRLLAARGGRSRALLRVVTREPAGHRTAVTRRTIALRAEAGRG